MNQIHGKPLSKILQKYSHPFQISTINVTNLLHKRLDLGYFHQSLHDWLQTHYFEKTIDANCSHAYNLFFLFIQFFCPFDNKAFHIHELDSSWKQML
jgi:hypothetical protein